MGHFERDGTRQEIIITYDIKENGELMAGMPNAAITLESSCRIRFK